MTVHGDDFTACGSDLDLAWLSRKFRDKFEVKIRILGPDRKHEQEVRILNRVVRWTDSGLTYEPDQRDGDPRPRPRERKDRHESWDQGGSGPGQRPASGHLSGD